MSSSESINGGAKDSVLSDKISESSDEKEQFVKRSAYEEVTADMHKYKQVVKETKAALNEREARLKAYEEEKMREQGQLKELLDKRDKEIEELRRSTETEKSRYIRAVKMNALKQELGGKIRDEYLSHANVDAIELREDGSLSPESIQLVANKFREEHSVLIPSNNSNSITNQAPVTNQTVNSGQRKLSEMTFEERSALLKNLKK